MNWVNAVCSVKQSVRRAWLEFLPGYFNIFFFVIFGVISYFLVRKKNTNYLAPPYFCFASDQKKAAVPTAYPTRWSKTPWWCKHTAFRILLIGVYYIFFRQTKWDTGIGKQDKSAPARRRKDGSSRNRHAAIALQWHNTRRESIPCILLLFDSDALLWIQS